jgi:transcriptional regulator with XRE-family HTH domain
MDEKRQTKLAKAIGAAIARARAASGLTQEDVAERLGIGNEAVSRMERGVVLPTLPRIFDFAEAYGCRVDELLFMASDREADQAGAMAALLAGLAPEDRALAVSMVEQVAARLRSKTEKRPRR